MNSAFLWLDQKTIARAKLARVSLDFLVAVERLRVSRKAASATLKSKWSTL